MESQQSENAVTPQSGDNQDKAPDQEQTESTTNNTDNPNEMWRFSNEEDPVVPSKAANTLKSKRTESISWTASEFVEHSKGYSWYLGLALAAMVLAALIFIITRDKISTSVVIVAAVAMSIFANRKPRVLEYRLDETGLKIGSKFYGYDYFKSFSVMVEGIIASIYLLPLKRFKPALSIYYDQKDQKKIINILSERLPHEDRHADVVDRFMHRIRF